VKYGNFTSRINQTYVPSGFNETDWVKIEVTDVSGKNITLHMSGAYKNGTTPDEIGVAFNVETGWANTSSVGYGAFFIIGANLTENDALPTFPSAPTMKINSTETRTYLGHSRTVCIFNLSESVPDMMDVQYVIVYDQASGVLLEMNASQDSAMYPQTNYQISFNIVDTNIFTTGLGGLLDTTTYIAIAVVVIIIIIVAIIALTRKKKTPTSESATETSTTET
jgi:hypothetical protein